MMSFQQRLEKCTNPLLSKLFNIIIEKKTLLCLAADFGDFNKIQRLIEKVGHHICILKVHLDQFEYENLKTNLDTLIALKKRYNFLLFEDRKFNDSAKTVQNAYERMCPYFDLVTVAQIQDDAIFEAIRNVIKNVKLPGDEGRGCLAVCEYSFQRTEDLEANKFLEVAQRNRDVCVGIIAQKLTIDDKSSMIKATPGINFSLDGDGCGQRWRGPEDAVRDGADIIIVGRGITAAPEDQWESLAIDYKQRSYDAYLNIL